MAKFVKGGGKSLPPISTASLPDIVFMLLFFFMVSTVMRETELKIKVRMPEATEVKKLERKNLVSYIHIGTPRPEYQATLGTEPQIQLNDYFADVDDIRQFIENERSARKEEEVPAMTTSLKVDENVKMGIVTDIKQELRKVQALKINYSTRKVDRK